MRYQATKFLTSTIGYGSAIAHNLDDFIDKARANNIKEAIVGIHRGVYPPFCHEPAYDAFWVSVSSPGLGKELTMHVGSAPKSLDAIENSNRFSKMYFSAFWEAQALADRLKSELSSDRGILEVKLTDNSKQEVELPQPHDRFMGWYPY